MKKIILVFVLAFSFQKTFCQEVQVFPIHWWVGMKHNKIQLLIKAPDQKFNSAQVNIKYLGITLDKINRLENEKFLALDITIDPSTKAGNVPLEFIIGKKTITIQWPLKQRNTDFIFAQGVTSEDLIYLIIPDRFSNGNFTNDKVKGLKDQSLNRDSLYHRHGGDIQGIINHLDYLQELGVTTVWLTPIFENDMPDRTEHGYSITNHYKIESRLGDSDLYKKLSAELHKRNMKLIQDAVYNHVGLYHILVQDKPTHDWLHEWPQYTNTNYKDQPLMDTHAVKSDQKKMSDGWFTKLMPDLNQSNPYVANFLIQHALWTVEEFSVDGWRIDTYIYNDLEFMNRCNQSLIDEYPHISLFGETWVHGVTNQAFFAQNKFNIPLKSNLPGVTDFQTNIYGIIPAVNEPFSWTTGVNRLYETLSSDFVYQDPTKNVNFLDNHDMSRFYSSVGEDIDKLKFGIAWLLTVRGIPQLYYGTEILMKGVSNPDGWVRLDFPGGWPTDKVNKFTAAGRSEKENEVFNWTKNLANFRKTSSALKTGLYTHYVPENGIYVYFRHDDKQTVMCIMNSNEKDSTVELTRFNEQIQKFTTGREVATHKKYTLTDKLVVKKKYLLVLELN